MIKSYCVQYFKPFFSYLRDKYWNNYENPYEKIENKFFRRIQRQPDLCTPSIFSRQVIKIWNIMHSVSSEIKGEIILFSHLRPQCHVKNEKSLDVSSSSKSIRISTQPFVEWRRKSELVYFHTFELSSDKILKMTLSY